MVKTSNLTRLTLILLVLITLAACRTSGPIFNPNPPPTLPAATIPVTVVVSTPTAVLAPTPTYDPTLPDWTIMVYASADNELAPFAWDDLNEMEAAGSSEQINVVAQIDWPAPAPDSNRPGPETVRYTITGDEADNTADQLSATADSLGERNMGDPATLADFLVWAMDSHPANRYALVLGGYGAGWHGLALDADTGIGDQNVADQTDYLSLIDLDQGLRTALETTGRDRLDIIALNASMMGQLDVLQLLQPYGRYAVASADLVPGAGWDYEPLLGQLVANPNTEPAVLAGQMVADYINVQTQLMGNDHVTMTAYDLAQLPPLAAAIESLAAALMQQPEQAADTAGDARRGAQVYGSAAPTSANGFAAIDLHHAAAILAERSPLESVAVAARAVMLAVDSAVLAHDHGPALSQGGGLALYWPATADFYDPAYSEATGLSNWETFLNSYLNAPPGTIAPQIALAPVSGSSPAVCQPAFLMAEVSGRQIGSVAFAVVQPLEDGRLLTADRRNISPATTTLDDGTTLTLWEDGLHVVSYPWDTAATFLQDAAGNGTYVVEWPVGDASDDEAAQVIQGQFRAAGREALVTGNLLFTPTNDHPTQLWAARPLSAASTPLIGHTVAEIPLAAIDAFQPTLFFAQEDGGLATEPGPLLPLAPDQPLSRQERPLPPGPYQVALSAVSTSGAIAQSSADLSIAEGANPDGTNPADFSTYATYTDLTGGFLFVYPAAWTEPATQDDIVTTGNVSDTVTLRVRQFPQWTKDPAAAELLDAQALQAEVLQTFGQVSLLLEEDIVLPNAEPAAGPLPARRVAYGYDHPQLGARTGILITFVHRGTGNGNGYLIDVDGPQTAEAETLVVADLVALSWQFAPPAPTQWTTFDTSTLHILQPPGSNHELSNDWHRLATAGHFLAYRFQPASREPDAAVRALVQSAGQAVANFNAGDPYPFLLGGQVWQRADFSYLSGEGTETIGLIMVRDEGGQEIAAWAEAPATEFAELSENIFLVSIADLEEETGD